MTLQEQFTELLKGMNEKDFTYSKYNKFRLPMHKHTGNSDDFHVALAQESIVKFLGDLVIKEKNLSLCIVLSKFAEVYTGVEWNSEIDSKFGDLYVFEADEYGRPTNIDSPVGYIDVKVSDDDYFGKLYTATITKRSYNNFATDSNKIYLCFTCDGRLKSFINAFYLKKYMENNKNDPKCPLNDSLKFIKGMWLMEHLNNFSAI